MDYEKKYKEALERAREYHSVDIDNTMDIKARGIMEYLFPELKESEDERIRGAIIHFISHTPTVPKGIIGKKIMIAWLEKQGKTYTKKDVDDAWLKGMCDAKRELEKQKDTNVFDVPKISIKDAIEVTSRMQYIEDDMKPIAEFIMDYASWNLHKDEWNQPVLEVPLFRVLDALIQRGKPYCECGQNIEKQGEQKLFDYENANIQQKDFAPKVEPKFKVKYAGSEYNVLEIKEIAGVTYYGIEDEPNHIDYVLPDNCEIVSERKSSWSEEDEKHYKACLQYFPDMVYYKDYQWLKSLKQRIGG